MSEVMITCDQGFNMKSGSWQRAEENGRGLTNHRPLYSLPTHFPRCKKGTCHCRLQPWAGINCKATSHCVGYAMLMSPNKAKTYVHDCKYDGPHFYFFNREGLAVVTTEPLIRTLWCNYMQPYSSLIFFQKAFKCIDA